VADPAPLAAIKDRYTRVAMAAILHEESARDGTSVGPAAAAIENRLAAMPVA
jgi:hypothetical protein